MNDGGTGITEMEMERWNDVLMEGREKIKENMGKWREVDGGTIVTGMVGGKKRGCLYRGNG